MAEKLIYLDNAATTRPLPEVIRAMDEVLEESWANPESPHIAGQAARKALDRARKVVAEAIGAKPSEIIFTSGATEANNLVIRGVRGKIITTAVEHKSVLDTAKPLGAAVVGVDKSGRVEPSELARMLTAEMSLVSMQLVNNEVGTIQPVKEIADDTPALFHIDAVQAFYTQKVDVGELGADLLSISGHKLHGPKGIGVLYAREGTELRPLITGGGQERGKRAGTQNVAGAVGLAKALELAESRRTDRIEKLKELKAKLIHELLELASELQLVSPADSVPNITTYRLTSKTVEPLIAFLDSKRIAVGSGSACTSGALEPSHVLAAMGYDDKDRRSMRISFSEENEVSDISELKGALAEFFGGAK